MVGLCFIVYFVNLCSRKSPTCDRFVIRLTTQRLRTIESEQLPFGDPDRANSPIDKKKALSNDQNSDVNIYKYLPTMLMSMSKVNRISFETVTVLDFLLDDSCGDTKSAKKLSKQHHNQTFINTFRYCYDMLALNDNDCSWYTK